MMAGSNDSEKVHVVDDAAQQAGRRRVRSIAIAIGLGVLAAMFYAATIVHLGGNALNRSM
jgi:hypothetical protein